LGNFRSAAVESDSQMVTYWGRITNCCIDLLQELNSFSISWVRQMGNEVAHYRARLVATEPNKERDHHFPPNIITYMQKAIGLIFF